MGNKCKWQQQQGIGKLDRIQGELYICVYITTAGGIPCTAGYKAHIILWLWAISAESMICVLPETWFESAPALAKAVPNKARDAFLPKHGPNAISRSRGTLIEIHLRHFLWEAICFGHKKHFFMDTRCPAERKCVFSRRNACAYARSLG